MYVYYNWFFGRATQRVRALELRNTIFVVVVVVVVFLFLVYVETTYSYIYILYAYIEHKSSVSLKILLLCRIFPLRSLRIEHSHMAHRRRRSQTSHIQHTHTHIRQICAHMLSTVSSHQINVQCIENNHYGQNIIYHIINSYNIHFTVF